MRIFSQEQKESLKEFFNRDNIREYVEANS